MTFLETAQSWWNGLTNATTDTVAWFQQVGYSVAGGIGQILYYPFKEIMGFIASIGYLFYVLVTLFSQIFAPIFFITDFLGGFFAGISENFTLATGGFIYQNYAIINFITSFPEYYNLMIVVNAAIWVMLGFHIVRELKSI